MREPGNLLRGAGAEDDSGAGPTVLRTLVEERHWQTPKAFRAQFLRAARELADRDSDREFGRLDVSQRQFCRWLAGAQPRPYACRVLEYMFGLPIGELLRPAVAPVPPDGGGSVGAQFGAVLRSLRVQRGLSLRRLGRLVHYSHGYLWDLESGGKRPTQAVVSALDAALGADGQLLAVAADVPASPSATPARPGPVVAAQPAAAPVEVRVFVGADALLSVPVGVADVVVQAGSVRVLIGPAAGVASAAATGPDRVAGSAGGARVYSLEATRRHRLGQAG